MKRLAFQVTVSVRGRGLDRKPGPHPDGSRSDRGPNRNAPSWEKPTGRKMKVQSVFTSKRGRQFSTGMCRDNFQQGYRVSSSRWIGSQIRMKREIHATVTQGALDWRYWTASCSGLRWFSDPSYQLGTGGMQPARHPRRERFLPITRPGRFQNFSHSSRL